MGPFGSILEVWSALLRQAWLILVILAVGLPSVYIYAKSRPRTYEATAVAEVQNSQEIAGIPGTQLPGLSINERLDEIERVLMSRERLLEVVETFDLFPGLESETLRTDATRNSVSFHRLFDPSQYNVPDAQPYGLAISVRMGDPELVASLANHLLEKVVSEDARLANERLTDGLDHMNDILGYLRAEESRVGIEIEAVEAEIAEFRRTNVDALRENIPFLRERLTELEAQRIAIERELSGLERAQGQLNSTSAERLRVQLNDQLAQILDETAALARSLESAPEVERQLGALTRRVGTLEAELEAIAMQRTQASMTQTFATGSQVAQLFIQDEALVPEFASSGSRRRIAMLGGAAVAALALGLALARELLHPVIRTAAQMQRQLDIAPVVVIPMITPPVSLYRRFATVGLFVLLLSLAWVASSQLPPTTTDTIFNLLSTDVPTWIRGEG